MKKKVWLIGLLLCFSLGLTACGNPLKKLPEATGDNIYDEDEDTTGNEAADKILDELMDDDNIKGEEVISFIIDDRDDDEDGKDRSELEVVLTTQSEDAEYTYYFEVKCRYDKDRGWRVKEYEINSRKDSTITPLSGVSEEALEYVLQNDIYSAYVGNAYLNFNDMEITDIKITGEEITPGILNAEVYRDQKPTSSFSAAITCEGDYCIYTIDGDFTFYFNEDGEEDSKWRGEDCEFAEEYAMELTQEAAQQLSEEAMLAELANREIRIGHYSDIKLTSDLIEDYTFGDISFSGSYCYRTAEITLKEGAFDITLEADFTYQYDGSQWNFSYISVNNSVTGRNLTGNYSAAVSDSSGEQIGSIYYSILSDNVDGEVTGIVKYVPEGTDASAAEAVEFTGNVSDSGLYVYLSFDKGLIRLRYTSTFYYDYLYYNVNTQRLEGYYYDYTLRKEE